MAHSCFSCFLASFNMSIQLSGHKESGLIVARIFVKRLSGLHSLRKVSRSITWISWILSPSSPIIVDTLFLQHIQICVKCPGHVSTENDSSFGHRSELEVLPNDDKWSLFQSTTNRWRVLDRLGFLLVETHPGLGFSNFMISSKHFLTCRPRLRFFWKSLTVVFGQCTLEQFIQHATSWLCFRSFVKYFLRSSVIILKFLFIWIPDGPRGVKMTACRALSILFSSQ